MEIPKDVMLQVLKLKITVIFKLFNGKYELCGERNITSGKKSYAVAEILSTNVIKLDDLSKEDIQNGGFPSKDLFLRWWISHGHTEHNPIYVVRFNILRLKPLGKWYLRAMNEHIPHIKSE